MTRSQPYVCQVFLLLPSSKVNHHYKRDLAYAVGVKDVFKPFLGKYVPFEAALGIPEPPSSDAALNRSDD